jgi:type I restriction enzyme M protein
MPDKLFLNTPIEVSLWFVAKDRQGNSRRHRQRTGEVLFIDARKLGVLESRRLRVLPSRDIAKIADVYHSWRNHDGSYSNVPGFAKAASHVRIKQQGFMLNPGVYVGAGEFERDDEPLGEKIARLRQDLYAEFEYGHELEAVVRQRLGGLP